MTGRARGPRRPRRSTGSRSPAAVLFPCPQAAPRPEHRERECADRQHDCPEHAPSGEHRGDDHDHGEGTVDQGGRGRDRRAQVIATRSIDAAVEALCGDLSSIRAPRGTELNTRSWSTEAPLRMLLNNLDREVAERPEDLVVYGGSGKAARNPEALRAIVRSLLTLGGDEALLV